MATLLIVCHFVLVVVAHEENAGIAEVPKEEEFLSRRLNDDEDESEDHKEDEKEDHEESDDHEEHHEEHEEEHHEEHDSEEHDDEEEHEPDMSHEDHEGDEEEHEDADKVKWALTRTEPDHEGDGDENEEEEHHLPKLTLEELGMLHKKIDQDGSGKMSVTELLNFDVRLQNKLAKEETIQVMKEMDTDNSGGVSLQELIKHGEDDPNLTGPDDEQDHAEIAQWKKLEEEKFAAADANKDNVLDNHELAGFLFPETNSDVLDVVAKATLERNDLNKDGKVDLEELEADERNLIAHSEMEAHDKNGDGVWELSEVKEWESGKLRKSHDIENIIKIADQNNDGHVTIEELDAAQEELQKGGLQEYLVQWSRGMVHHGDL